MALGIHTEETFEGEIAAHLLAHGYEAASSASFDRARGLFPSLVVDFVKATQPTTWAALRAILKDSLEALLLKEACKVMDAWGSLEVLRHGFTFYGKKVRLAYFEPGSQKNPALWDLYAQNRLSVVRQLRYDPKSDGELDLVLCLNGVPIVTCELKNAITGQTAEHAKLQYQADRDPAAPIFAFKSRALVHFAVDADVAWMTTRLAGKDTRFLPFNRGHDHGAGNPPVPGKHRTSYLWEEVWERRSLLDLVGRFIHLQAAPGSREALIFPRYHQLDCVRRLEAAARARGPGSNYLVQHSAGSGKSNSIAWLAHRLASLHDAADEPVYHSVVVLTDRRVLDQQLQNTIYQFDHREGVVEKIDKRSDQLAQALTSGAPIIISTIHKFGFIQDKVGSLPDRRYAVIVDEAHSSQSGDMAAHVTEMLADEGSIDERLAQHLAEDDLAAPDQAALRKALLRGPQPNMSFFAFTATPKFKTLELFGHQEHGKPAPFHLYAMRQAIEEGFILDVLRGYTTYARFFQLAKAVADDPQLDKLRASTALARFVNLHPTNIAQKTELIIEHFRSTVMHHLGGRAKAMVVTGSRLQAVKYKLSFDGYLQRKGYGDIRCLVAFSGEVADDDAPGVTYTEAQMNGGISESELPERFASSAYQVVLVANKYQTGFDQPLLMAMYVDKRLSGIQAVQTLSRLNRTAPGKERTFVLDFVNAREEILASFQAYYETTGTADEVDPQRLYELQRELLAAQVFTASELSGFAAVFYQLPASAKLSSHARLNGWLDPAVDRFNAIKTRAEATPGGEDARKAAVEAAVSAQEAFRGRLIAFKNLYGFLAQIVPFSDAELEKLYAFGRMLLRKLPRPATGGPLHLDDDVELKGLQLKHKDDGDLPLQKGKGGALGGPGATGTGGERPPKERLSTIIKAMNRRFGLELPEHLGAFIDGVGDAVAADEKVCLGAEANDKANFALIFEPALADAMTEHLEDNADFVTLFFKDPELRGYLTRHLLDSVYERVRAAAGASRAADGGEVLAFRRVPAADVRPFVNAVPLYELKAAAGRFSGPQRVAEVPQAAEVEDPDAFTWVSPGEGATPAVGLFVTQVVGESMNRRIPSGAYCLWRLAPQGPWDGKVVLAQRRDLADPAGEGEFTVKVFERAGEAVTLRPASTDPAFEALAFNGLADGELTVIAELVTVLGELP